MKRIMLLCALLVAVISGAAFGGIPHTMSYQGVLMNSDGSQAADSMYAVTFRLYDVESGGTDIWSEVDTVTTESGIFNVILGKQTPLDLGFDETYWLGLEIDGDELTPRTELTPSPYTFRAAVSDSAVEATHAAVADSAVHAAHAYVADSVLEADGDWTISGDDMYSAVPGSVGIGTDAPTAKLDIDADADVAMNIASEGHGALIEYQRDGGGYRFYTGIPDVTRSTWDVQDASHNSILAVEWDGKVGINTNSTGATLHIHGNPISRIHLTHPGTGTSYTRGVSIGYPCETCRDFIIWSYEDQPLRFGTHGTERLRIDAIGNVGIGTISPAQKLDVQGDVRFGGKVGIGTSEPTRALEVFGPVYIDHSWSNYHGIQIANSGSHGVLVTNCPQNAFHVANTGGDGVTVLAASDCGIDARGDHGNHLRVNHNSYHALTVHSWFDEADKPGLYVYGTFTATGAKGSVIETSEGKEALYCIEGPDVEFITSGTAKLVGGEARVTTQRVFQEGISAQVPVKVIVTPVGSWSGLYVTDASQESFTVHSGAGDPGASFTWMVIGRRKGYETKPDMMVPDEAE